MRNEKEGREYEIEKKEGEKLYEEIKKKRKKRIRENGK